MLIDTPSPDNRLTLDKDGEPVLNYVLSEPDKARFRRGVAQAVRIMFLAGAKQVYLPTTEDILGDGFSPVVLTDAKQADAVEKNLRFIPNRTIVTSAHMQATDKMGATEASSVVSRDFRVWGTSNLYVVDGQRIPDFHRRQSHAKHLHLRENLRGQSVRREGTLTRGAAIPGGEPAFGPASTDVKRSRSETGSPAMNAGPTPSTVRSSSAASWASAPSRPLSSILGSIGLSSADAFRTSTLPCSVRTFTTGPPATDPRTDAPAVFRVVSGEPKSLFASPRVVVAVRSNLARPAATA